MAIVHENQVQISIGIQITDMFSIVIVEIRPIIEWCCFKPLTGDLKTGLIKVQYSDVSCSICIPTI